MTSFLTEIAKTKPAHDQLEVSVFGPGVGESIVAHLGDGKWVIVDSCILRETGRPVALDYLEHIQADPGSNIAVVVATHWHDDHSRGLASVIEAASQAKFVCSGALNSEEFREFIAASKLAGHHDIGCSEMRKAISVWCARQRGRGASKGPRWASENVCLFRTAQSSLHALSPSSGTLSLALQEICSLIPSSGKPKRRAVANKPNRLAVVLGIQVGNDAALLGSDLETGPDARTGWKAILELEPYPIAKATAFKVPHHGSATAHEGGVWSQLLSSPVAAVTPFLAQKTPLPTKTDLKRLCLQARAVFLSSPSVPQQAPTRSRSLDRMMKRTTKRLVQTQTGMGLVRMRWTSGVPQVECFGKAKPITQQ